MDGWTREVSGLKERKRLFATTSGSPMDRVYTPVNTQQLDYENDLGLPGEYPFTRGIHPTGYRGKLWTMRQFSGYGTAEETNSRFKFLMAQGETGLSTAFDYPTLIGYDTDAPEARGEFGKCGVAVSSLRDMQILFDGIPLDKVTTSMTINGPAAVIWAMYIVAAEKQGLPINKLGGTIQNDILKEYIAQASYIYPPEPALRLVVDSFEYGTQFLPSWNTISISGYHIREAGATAQQELAFTLADGFAYVQGGIERGLDIDDFVPRFSFFFNCHNDFLEEIAKFRAARRIWSREMKERFGAKKERSWWMRFHTQTAGCSLTAQQPEINIVRTTIQALAAVLGGTQSLHTNSMDEALALPSTKAVQIALRTQQIIAHESGVASTVDPFGGSYAIETLTDQMETAAYDYFRQIDSLGGVLPAIEQGFFQKEIAKSAYRDHQEVEHGERTVVGVNSHIVDEPLEIPILRMDEEGEARQINRLNQLKRERDNRVVSQKLRELNTTAHKDQNLMPIILEAVRAEATLGEICGELRQVFGEYKELIVV
ncbi:MAG: methylmalonyl-CoA mutase family protein [Chloroflexota bacterium]|nr:methylmalonyl-CoA mutase family protein [Chloroflexota bacterium]